MVWWGVGNGGKFREKTVKMARAEFKDMTGSRGYCLSSSSAQGLFACGFFCLGFHIHPCNGLQLVRERNYVTASFAGALGSGKYSRKIAAR